MKKIIIICIVAMILHKNAIQTAADSIYIEPQLMRITYYLPTGNKTADGTEPYYGICAAKKDWIGKVAIIYDLNMRLIGFFEIRDTGGHTRIKEGKCIDLFMPTIEDAKAFIKEYGDYGYVQIIDADG